MTILRTMLVSLTHLYILTPDLHQMHFRSGTAALCVCSVQRRPTTHVGCVWSVAQCQTSEVLQ